MICKMTSIYKFTLCYPVFQDTNLKLKTKRVSAFQRLSSVVKKDTKAYFVLKHSKLDWMQRILKISCIFFRKMTNKCPFGNIGYCSYILDQSWFPDNPDYMNEVFSPNGQNGKKYKFLYLENKVYCIWVLPHETTFKQP